VHLGGHVATTRTSYPDSLAVHYGQETGEISGEAFGAEAGYFTRGLDVYANYSDFGKGVRNDLDYFPRAGFSHTEVGAGHTWQREAGSWWTMLNFGNCYTYEEKAGGDLRAKGYNFWINYAGPREADVDLTGWIGTNSYQGEELDTWELNAHGSFWPTGSLFLRGSVSYGGSSIDYANVRTGERLTVRPGMEVKLGRNLSAELAHTYERFDVDDGKLYTANISYLKAVYQFSARMFLRAIVQYVDYDRNTVLYDEPDDYDEHYENLASQLLLSYKINPRTVFFLGYSDSCYGDQAVDLTQTERTLFAKIGYAWTL
jgi:hypothetical protein